MNIHSAISLLTNLYVHVVKILQAFLDWMEILTLIVLLSLQFLMISSVLLLRNFLKILLLLLVLPLSFSLPPFLPLLPLSLCTFLSYSSLTLSLPPLSLVFLFFSFLASRSLSLSLPAPLLSFLAFLLSMSFSFFLLVISIIFSSLFLYMSILIPLHAHALNYISLLFTSCSDGFTYERSAIMSWLKEGKRTSPVTNLPLLNTALVPNNTLKKLLNTV